MMSSSPATNPPSEANDLLKVPMMRSTSSVRPKCSAVPRPLAITPIPCASSTISRAPCFLQTGIISGKFARSPRTLYRPSTTTSAPQSSLSFSSTVSRCSMSLCRNRRRSPSDNIAPSMMLAWSSLSETTESPLPTRQEITPKFTW